MGWICVSSFLRTNAKKEPVYVDARSSCAEKVINGVAVVWGAGREQHLPKMQHRVPQQHLQLFFYNLAM